MVYKLWLTDQQMSVNGMALFCNRGKLKVFFVFVLITIATSYFSDGQGTISSILLNSYAGVFKREEYHDLKENCIRLKLHSFNIFWKQ